MFRFTTDTETGSIEVLGQITYTGRKATHWDPEEGPEGEVTNITLIVTDGCNLYDVTIGEAYAIKLVGIRPWLRLVQAALSEALEEGREIETETLVEEFEPIYEYDIPW